MFWRATTVAAGITLAVAACGNTSDDAQPAEPATTTAPTATATTTTTPEDAFVDAVNDTVTITGRDPEGFATDALGLMANVCDMLDDADTDTDDSATEMLQLLTLAAIRDSNLDSEVVDHLFDLAGEHLCPDHADILQR